MAPGQLKAVQDGLEAVVGEEGRTGRRAAIPGLRISGKTGTSQVISNKSFKETRYDNRDHAWFTSYAPSDNPEVVVTVILEHTGGGGTYAAPVAKSLLAAYFDKTVVAESIPPAQVQPDLAAGFTRDEVVESTD